MDLFPEEIPEEPAENRPQLPLGCYLAITVVFTVGLAVGFLMLVSLVLSWALEVSR
jgi:hypothetical protein